MIEYRIDDWIFKGLVGSLNGINVLDLGEAING